MTRGPWHHVRHCWLCKGVAILWVAGCVAWIVHAVVTGGVR